MTGRAAGKIAIVTGAAAYEASNGAVRPLTKAAAIDLHQYDIRANSVHPCVIDTAVTRSEVVADGGYTAA